MTRMRRFEIQVVDEAGDAVTVAEGCQFPGGLAAINWAANPYVITEMASSLIAFMDEHVPGAVVWIDKDMSVLSPPEPEDHGKHAVFEPEDAVTHAKLEHFFEPEPPQQL